MAALLLLCFGALAALPAQAHAAVPASLLGEGVQQVVGGSSHTCALTSAGAVQCWGSNSDGQLGDGTTTDRSTPAAVSGLGGGVVSLAAGGNHTCALTSAGALQCWGSNSVGQLGDGTTTNSRTPVAVTGLGSVVASLAAGDSHTCAVTSAGAVQCWGRNDFGQLGDSTTTNSRTPVAVSGLGSGVVSLAAGASHTCAVTSAGAVQCWGRNDFDQLGDGTTTNSRTPVAVTGLGSGVVSLAAGDSHTCAVTSAGAVQCWGYNGLGQLGDGTHTFRSTPVAVTGLGSGVVSLAAGDSHTCAVTSTGAVQCWGDNLNSQLGDGTTATRFTPVAVSGLGSGVASLTAGSAHTCAVTSAGAMQCWGNNGSGQLGDGTTTNRSTPVVVSGLGSGVAFLVAARNHTCALTSAGAVQCWGYNASGQLGDGTTTDRSTPVAVSGLGSGVVSLAAGSGHTCAVTSAGAVQCWGFNGNSTLGDGTNTNRSTPVAVPGLGSGMVSVAAGGNHTCALTSNGAVQCWGYNVVGQLGDGTTTNRSTPVAVPSLGSGVVSLAAGSNHTCALTSAGAVQCWGYNASGQLGDGTNTDRSTPVAVPGLGSGVVSLVAGGNHTCAVTSAGALQCWGNNSSGQLGDGTTTNRSTPVAVSGLGSGVASLAASINHTCALTSAGAMQCWGRNTFGQLGDSTTTDRSTPVAVTSLGSGVASLAAGNFHTCARTSAGAVQCWGYNGTSQLGDSTTTQRTVPTHISASQAINFTALAQLRAGTTRTLTGSASSALALTFDTWTPDVCTVSGNTLTVLPGKGAYLCGVRALQAGGLVEGTARYVAARPRLQLLSVQTDVPLAPAALVATPGDAAVALAWNAALANGSTITGYAVTGAPSGGGASVGCTTTGALACTVNGLANGTAYAFTVTATNAVGTGAASLAASATPNVFVAPTLALPTGGNARVQIGAPPGCTVGSPQFSSVLPAAAPPGGTFPLGVLRFTASGSGCSSATLNVRIDYPAGALQGLQPRKFGPPTAGAPASWFAHGTIVGDTVTYTVTDNGVGDSNTTLGQIEDPFGPALLPAAPGSVATIPTLSQWGVILMSLMAAAMGMLAARRRR